MNSLHFKGIIVNSYRFCSIKRTFRELNQTQSRVQVKQSVGDKRKLQQLLETEVKSGKIVQTLERTSKYDDGFKDFLEEFKKKNNFPNIIDMTRFSEGQNLLKKPQQLREEELKLLKDFADKRKQGLFGRTEKLFQKEKVGNKEYPTTRKDSQMIKIKPDEMGEIPVQQTRSGLQIGGDFTVLLIDKDVNTKVTTLQRVNSFRQLVFMGDCNGVVGYGQGKGGDFETALEAAIIECKRNLVPIQLDIFHTCPLILHYKFNRFQLTITPRADGMNAYGHPLIASMLMLAGITHCKFKVHHTSRTPYALVNAFMGAVTQNISPVEISERTGHKIYRQYWGKKLPREIVTYPLQ